MLSLTISGERRWDDEKEEFIPASKDYTLQMEHSLISLFKWEGIYCKPFLSTEKDMDMIKAYAKCMTINNVPDDVFDRLTPEHISAISDYIQNDMTATWFSDHKKAHKNGRNDKGEIITAELIYYWMISYNIPVEFQKWHLNRLLTLIRVLSVKNDPKNDKKPKMTAEQRRALNKARQAKYHTRG